MVASGNTPDFSINSVSFNSNNATDTAVRPRLLINGTTSLAPVADSMVNGGAASTNYGSAANLNVRYNYGNATYSMWSYLRFDLSGVSSISTAELRLNRVAAANTTIFPVGVYGCSNTTWIEGNNGTDNLPAGELTWNNRPAALSSTGDPQGSPNLWVGSKGLAGGRVAISGTNPNTLVWWPINASPYYSNDRGVSWTLSTGAPATQIVDIYGNGNSVAAFGQPLTSDRGNGNFYLARFGSTAHLIYRSTDSGANWTQIASVSNGSSYNMRGAQLVAAPVSPACPSGGDLWLSDDGTYNGAGGGLWRSTDSGITWTKITTIGKVSQVSFGKALSGSGYTVFVNGINAAAKGVYRSDNYGTSWVKLTSPTIQEISALAGDRQNYGTVFIGTHGRGVFQGQ